MVTSLLDYTFDGTTVSNSDGSNPMEIEGATVVKGPGRIGGVTYPKALSLGSSGAGSVEISDLDLDTRRFRVRIIFRLKQTFEGRQNLVESNHLPFALFLRGQGRSGTRLVASVRAAAHGWRSADTRFGSRVTVDEWHVADLVYDLDTVGVFLDDEIVSVHAFPNGRLELLDGARLFVGTWVDGRRDHFNGSVAALELDAGIPAELETQLDERRSSAEWFITRKAELLRDSVDMGEPTEAIEFNGRIGAWTQPWSNGAFMYHPSAGAAFEMHGAIHARYRKMRNRDELGHLVTDEEVATDSRGRKSLFSRGGIYWSSDTGAHEVLGQLYLDYEAQGESRAWGFPVAGPKSVPGGTELRLQRARMYHRDGAPSAHEVHGAILNRFLATGGVGTWGFPITNETPLLSGSREIGRSSEFERCTFYWSSRTGAHEVHGDIHRKYLDLGGPAGELGLPTTDEEGFSGGRMSGFQNGTLCWYGSFASIVVARPFKLFIGTLNTKESEGAFMGQNDLYLKVTVKHGSSTVHSARYPRSGDWGGRNVRDVNITLPPVITPDPARAVTLVIDVREADPGSDDKIGKWTKRLDATNGWGLRENNGILDSGSIRKINNIRASVKPQVDIASLSEPEKFWGVANQDTDDLSRAQYANAFRDVDSETEWWDISDGLDSIFYELVVKDIAEDGNCFGMCLESIYARKGLSPFALPLDRFSSWGTIRPTVNVKHAYQVGASAIWWFLGQFATGNTHDPVDVFNRTHAAHGRGDHPVLCIAQNYDFSGAPHVVLPVAWNKSSRPWRMEILDPNFPGKVRDLTVDPSKNEFRYVGSDTYTGGEWTGGRMHYMPFSILDTAVRTPVWDAILLLLSGTIIILGGDAETESITDADGNDIDAYGSRAKQQLQNSGTLDGYFATFRGFDGAGVLPSEVLLAREGRSPDVTPGPAAIDPGILVNATISELGDSRDARRLRDRILGSAGGAALGNRTVSSIAADPDAVKALNQRARKALDQAVATHRPGDFVHRTTSKRRGRLRYAVKHGLSEAFIDGPAVSGTKTRIRGKDLATLNSVLEVESDRDTKLDVALVQKQGVGRDRTEVRLSGLPAAKGKAVAVAPRPGMGAVDVTVGGTGIDVPVEVISTADGRTARRRFTVPVGTTRIMLSSAFTEGLITASRTSGLLGTVLDSNIIEARD